MDYELSYLIRLGAGKHPQAFGAWWKDEEGYTCEAVADVVATCAMGAAHMALVHLTGQSPAWAIGLISRLDALARNQVVGWNDDQRLPREEIADRLDALPGGSPVIHVPD